MAGDKEEIACKCPKPVAFWDSIPKTIIGKIIKKDIKAMFWEGKERVIG